MGEQAAVKSRLDVRLMELGLASSRERAKELVQQGLVTVDGKPAKKAGQMLEAGARIEVTGGTKLPYVGRGGLKLEKALDVFEIDLKDKVCLDAGASTGGFTDCMLQNGAAKVFAVDVGHGQLAEKLRSDARVVNMENTNVRELTPAMLGECCHFASVDLSFISLTKVIPAIASCLVNHAEMVCLVKPQFEAGRSRIGKKGVVKDVRVHAQVLEEVGRFCQAMGMQVKGLTPSPIRGQEGNREFLLYLQKTKQEKEETQKGGADFLAALIAQAVQADAEQKERQ